MSGHECLSILSLGCWFTRSLDPLEKTGCQLLGWVLSNGSYFQGRRKHTGGMEKILGTVKWFSRVKGYGFIQPDAEGNEEVDDVFVHYSAIVGKMVDGNFQSMTDKFRNLKEGERVEFVIEDTPKGPQASNVVKL